MAKLTDEKATPITITFFPSLLEEVDRQAEQWFTNRSAAFTRIYLEWREANMRQAQLPGLDKPQQEKVAA
jgi:metal-responsive CopG/Arc/MetJ family transcriptional regulator